MYRDVHLEINGETSCCHEKGEYSGIHAFLRVQETTAYMRHSPPKKCNAPHETPNTHQDTDEDALPALSP